MKFWAKIIPLHGQSIDIITKQTLACKDKAGKFENFYKALVAISNDT